MRNTLLILDFTGKEGYALAYMLRSERFFCRVVRSLNNDDPVWNEGVRGVIIVGAPKDSEGDSSLRCALDRRFPVLALGGAAAAVIEKSGGTVKPTDIEKRTCDMQISEDRLLTGIVQTMRYFDVLYDITLPDEMFAVARTEGTVCAFRDETGRINGCQFTAEQNDPDSLCLLSNFATTVCGLASNWDIDAFLSDFDREVKETVGDGEAILAVSGGVDSAVCALLMNRAIGSRVHCLFVDTGLMNGDEADILMQMGIPLTVVDVSERCFEALRGVKTAEEKRRRVSDLFAEVFRDTAAKTEKIRTLVRGTIYPDVLENRVNTDAYEADFDTVYEPIRYLLKEEVRSLAEKMLMPRVLSARKSFPRTGLAVRVIGEVTPEKIAVLRTADAIFARELTEAGLERKLNRFFAVLTDIRDEAGKYVLALRAVSPSGTMSHQSYRMPYDLLNRAASAIIAETEMVGRVVYDITPGPASVEWQ